MMQIEVMNGWKDAPHCWRHYWKVSFKREYVGYQLTIFGFVVWFV